MSERLEEKMDELIAMSHARDMALASFKSDVSADIGRLDRKVSSVKLVVEQMKPQVDWLARTRGGVGFMAKVGAWAGGVAAGMFAIWQAIGDYVFKLFK